MKNDTSRNRRDFVRLATGLAAGGLVAGLSLESRATERGFTMSSDTTGRCISCQYWGGVRRVSEDRRQITAETLGWCNNPDSMSYQKTTPPDLGPMKSWRRWGALG